MNQESLKQTLGKVDIYLLDQVMKNRYSDNDKILDAGCGQGRNLHFLNDLGLNIEGCDADKDTIEKLQYTLPKLKLTITDLANLSYNPEYFDHIICNAVLHFAHDEIHFIKMINELFRILKPNGTLFIRMTSIFGLESDVIRQKGQYLLPDGSVRFLLTSKLIETLKTQFIMIEPLKTVNISNIRCMSTLLLEKK
jgi:tellurite methyltransferase